jgi:dienelactone hydrolase
MKNFVIILSLILFSNFPLSAQENKTPAGDIIRVEAKSENGFSYPYYLFVPSELRDEKARKQTHTILVLPNNTGKLNDSLDVHEADVKKRIERNRTLGSMMKTVILTPVFPRPETDWKIYTHALDRDAMLTDKKEFSRFDLQLIAMIDDARTRLKKDELKLDKKVLMMGFSASGMFTNRFAFLHPTRVKAAAIGSPGGWAIAPVAAYKEKTLRYPIGVNDLKNVSGETLNLNKLRKVPLFVFLGDKDTNDSVIFGDGYEEEDKALVFEIFGKTPVERWEISKSLYEQAKLNAQFKLYPNVEHTVNAEMQKDIKDFFLKYI